MKSKDGKKTSKRANNACEIFFLALVKYVQNFTLFFFAKVCYVVSSRFFGILMAFNLVNIKTYFKRGFFFYIITCFLPLKMCGSLILLIVVVKYILCCFFCMFTFVAIYALLWVQ